jgi:hypothetical protein
MGSFTALRHTVVGVVGQFLTERYFARQSQPERACQAALLAHSLHTEKDA